jgi:methylglutaconyl-CoA hydratase
MTDAPIALDVDDRGVATLTLNRPDKHNALSGETCDALRAAAARLSATPGLRAVVLTGAGESFCAGGDLGWMKAQFAATRAQRIVEARRLADMLQSLNTLDMPLIGRVNGAAYGGGVGLISVCDAVVAVETAKFGLTETRLGLIPATISPYVIARMGEGRARSVFFSSRVFDAAEAQALGLVGRVVGADALDAAVAAEVGPYLKTAPEAVAAAKRLARSLGPRIDAATVAETVERLADVWETEAARDGVTAFLEKRPAPWVR